ncbi:MAG: hypothetical protein ABSA49_16155, partial [Rhizomicrobium sp.]
MSEILSQIAVQVRGRNEQPNIADLIDPIDKEVVVSSKVLLDRVNLYQRPPSIFNFHRTLHCLIRIFYHALNDESDG